MKDIYLPKPSLTPPPSSEMLFKHKTLINQIILIIKIKLIGSREGEGGGVKNVHGALFKVRELNMIRADIESLFTRS